MGMTGLIQMPIDLVESGARVFPITADLYHRMIERGDVEEGAPFELLDGIIVRKDRSAAGDDPMTVGDDHTQAVTALTQLAGLMLSLGCHLRVQQPVALGSIHEPEPDGALVRGGFSDYRGKPKASDVVGLIEVSDSSLRHDRSTKARIYAEHAIPWYVIVNLVERTAELYTRPEGVLYRHRETLGPEQELALTTPGGLLRIKVADLLPPR